jgi:superfamily II DNA or RNA helicase
MILIRDSAIRIPQRFLKEDWCVKIINDLTRSSKTYGNAEDEETRIYYSTEDNDVLIPRFYPVQKFDIMIDDIRGDGMKISVQSKVKPRNFKQEVAINWMVESNEGILCMQPGEGKTVVTIDALCKIGRKTIIFVHKNDLGSQWIDRFIEHTEIGKSSIGWLRSESFKSDLQNPIVVSTVQTFCSLVRKGKEFLDEVKKADFGVAVWDECHTSISAEMFSKTSLHLPVKKVFGLSATPERLDGNTDVMFMHLTNIFKPEGQADTMVPEVRMIHFDHKIVTKYKYQVNQLYLAENNSERGRFSKAVYLSKLIKSETLITRLRQIVKQIDQSKRNALILSERINLLEEARKVVSHSDSSLYVGTTDEKEKNEALSKRIIFSTYSKSRDGLDIPRLDCIVFCTAVSNIDQAAGRIVRTLEGKKSPVVIDIVDSGSDEMINRSKYRRKFYTQKNWIITDKRV